MQVTKSLTGFNGSLEVDPLISGGLTLPQSSEPGLLLEWFGKDPIGSPDVKPLHSNTTVSAVMYCTSAR
jgi:hypothetical protein